MPTAKQKAEHFTHLHQREDKALILPNAWDVGSARMLESMGFEAIATTSAGFAFSLGKRDWPGEVKRAEALGMCKAIVKAVDAPVSADLENGFGLKPETVAETIRQAAAAGLAGCTIEDTSGKHDAPIIDFKHAVERISAAVHARNELKRPFMLTARAENFLHGRPDLDDTISRLIAFEAAGADVLYAPGLASLADIEKVCEAVSRPVNVVIGTASSHFTVAGLEAAGVKRISMGSSFARAAIGGFLQAAREVMNKGTFEFAGYAASFAQIDELLKR
ncbi:MAG: isocitrate lyase/phosphoenolpyruvate mutase family protein [Anderseniella sp.]|jgi:2-methylisocitrate lyase-like PEP mutase family enzyme|nr:isocitrate lyase/phosphoenolpyruvate mutase family protein [Anderseniella sp.]